MVSDKISVKRELYERLVSDAQLLYDVMVMIKKRRTHLPELSGFPPPTSERMYSGNQVCLSCGHRKSIVEFKPPSRAHCTRCIDLAYEAYHMVVNRCKDGSGNVDWQLIPEKNTYMKDYLKRMEKRREEADEANQSTD